MLALALNLSLLAAVPQGPVAAAAPAPRSEFGYPADPTAAMYAPFVDALGLPVRTGARAAGLADVDGDGNPDAWFLAGGVARDGDLAIAWANAADLGRYVRHAELVGGGFRGATTFHRAGVADTIVLVGPGSNVPQLAFHQAGYPDPRSGAMVVQPTIWPVGAGMVAVDARDPDGDGHDDLVVLRELGPPGAPTGCEITRLHFGVGAGGHQLLSTASAQLPFVADRLLAADLDGDRSTDVVLHAPGIGVVALTIDAAGTFGLHAVLELPAGYLTDLTVGDLGADGRDDWVAVLADGCVTALSVGPTSSLGAVLRPATQPDRFVGARLVDATGDGALDLVAIPGAGGILTVFPYFPPPAGSGAANGQFGAAEFRAAPAGYPDLTTGPGIAGTTAVAADVDGDGDADLVLQLPGGDRWLTLRAAGADLGPEQVRAVTVGTPSSAGFVQQRFTIDVPAAMLAAGFTELEVALFVEDPQTGESIYWDRTLVQPDPVTRRATVTIQAMLDPLFADWLWQNQITRHPQTGELTAFGPTVVTIHGKQGPRRTTSRLVRWDGEGDPHGSAVGVRWRIVAAPPLPTSDAQLLPWD